MNQTLPCVSWGLNDLDAILGPMIFQRLYLVGARPSNGKTAFVLSFINRHMETLSKLEPADYKVMPKTMQVFLTERKPDIAMWAWAAVRAGYDEDSVLMRDWENLPHGAEKRVHDELDWIKAWYDKGLIEFVDMARPTVTDIARHVDARWADIVVFDHIQRVKPEGRQNEFTAVGEAAHMFQSIANDNVKIVMVMSQLKRRGDGVFDKYRPPHLEDFKKAGEIEEDADVALGLFRPLSADMTNDHFKQIRDGQMDLERFKVRDTMAIKVLKHRYRGRAADQIVRVRIANGKIEDKDRVPF